MYSPSDLTRNFRTKITVCDECEENADRLGSKCWLFASTDKHGYPKFKLNGKSLIGHRYAYEKLVGEIPDGLDLDHLCRGHRNCCNPDHLTPVEKSENSRRANARRWHDKEVS